MRIKLKFTCRCAHFQFDSVAMSQGTEVAYILDILDARWFGVRRQTCTNGAPGTKLIQLISTPLVSQDTCLTCL